MNIDKSIKIQEKLEKEMAFYDKAKEYLLCDFETGLITWIKTTARQIKIGDIVKDKDCEGYIRIGLKGRKIKAHRFIFYCYHGVLYPIIDHKDTIKYNNWISNLRGGNNHQNMGNQIKPHCRNKSGFLGVSIDNNCNKYKASIGINGKCKHLGYFNTPELANEAYLKAKRIHHEFCTI